MQTTNTVHTNQVNPKFTLVALTTHAGYTTHHIMVNGKFFYSVNEAVHSSAGEAVIAAHLQAAIAVCNAAHSKKYTKREQAYLTILLA